MEGDHREDLLLVDGDHPHADRLLEAEEDTPQDLHDPAAQDDQIHMGLQWVLQVEVQQCLSQPEHLPCIQARERTQNQITPAAR